MPAKKMVSMFQRLVPPCSCASLEPVCGGGLFFRHIAAIFVVGMTVRRIECFLEGDTSLPAKARAISTAGDDFIAWQEAFDDLHGAIRFCAPSSTGVLTKAVFNS
jgi:hypothetical protein